MLNQHRRPVLIGLALLVLTLAFIQVRLLSSAAIQWRPLNDGLRSHARVFALAVSPTDPQVVLAGVGDAAALYRSTDGGRHWQPWNDGLPSTAVHALRFAPDGQSILAGSEFGVYRRELSGAQWTPMGTWPQATRIYGLVYTSDDRLFTAADELGVWQWDGARWQRIGDERLSPALAIAADPTDPRKLAVGTGGRGLYVSRDGGATWESSGSPAPFDSTLVAALAFQPDGRALYARAVSGLYRSDDGGRSWVEERGPIGLDKISAIVFDPQRVLVSVGEEGSGVLARALSGGTWQRLNKGLHPRISASALAIAPSQPGTLYLGGDNQGAGGGVWRSDDGGQTWDVASDGLGAPLVYDLAVDAADEQTLYAATWDGIYRSTDAGQTWQLASDGLDGHRAFSVAVGPRGSTRVYAGSNGGGVSVSDHAQHWHNSSSIDDTGISQVVVDPRDDQVAYAKVIFDRLYKTTDGGQRWRSIWNGIEDSQELVSATLDPRNADRLLAGATDGVYLSENGGTQWRRVGGLLDDQTVFALAADPSMPRVWFAGATRGLYRSADDGLTWSAVGLAGVTVTCLAVDGAGRVYIGTKYHGLSVLDHETIAPAGWPDVESSVNAIRLTPSGVIYAATPQGVYRGEWR